MDKPNTFSLMQRDVVRHGGAISGMLVGGLAGSILPGIGTLGGMLVGGIIGGFAGHHALDKRRA